MSLVSGLGMTCPDSSRLITVAQPHNRGIVTTMLLYESYKFVNGRCSGKCVAGDVAAHHGLCPACWLKLKPCERAILGGQKELEVVERVRVIYPARRWNWESVLLCLVLAMFLVGVAWINYLIISGRL
jgi:hypothetical protein